MPAFSGKKTMQTKTSMALAVIFKEMFQYRMCVFKTISPRNQPAAANIAKILKIVL